MKLEFTSKENGLLIKQILANYPKLNYNQLKSVLRKKDIKINNKRVSADTELFVGDKIEIFLPNQKEKQIPIIYEDENIIIANKPAGIETTKDDKNYDSLSLEEIVSNRACHRLDKNTEGLVILAKNNMAYGEILKAFKERKIQKFYTCIVFGKQPKNEDKLTAFLIKDEKKSLVKIFDKKMPNSVEIKTNYKVLETFENTSLLLVELLTGKTHQIRAHLSHIGCSIVGDDKYGSKEKNKKFLQKHLTRAQECVIIISTYYVGR